MAQFTKSAITHIAQIISFIAKAGGESSPSIKQAHDWAKQAPDGAIQEDQVASLLNAANIGGEFWAGVAFAMLSSMEIQDRGPVILAAFEVLKRQAEVAATEAQKPAADDAQGDDHDADQDDQDGGDDQDQTPAQDQGPATPQGADQTGGDTTPPATPPAAPEAPQGPQAPAPPQGEGPGKRTGGRKPAAQ